MISLLVIIFLLSFFLTNVIRKLAISHQLLDHPNHRSAHTIPTPRGGGLAIVISICVGLIYLTFSHYLSLINALTILCSGSMVALSGFLDDKFSLTPSTRLCMQLVAVLIGIYGLGSFTSISLFSFDFTNTYLLVLFSILYLMWLTNLYNFMDGINGIAGLQAISVSSYMFAVYYFTLGSMDYLPLLIAVSSAGFLYWNFPRAKIFMGDVGSGYLGLLIGLVSISHAQQAPQLLFTSLILMGVFIVDASYTLGRRFIQGKKVHQAHSSHAYQHLARKSSHTQVSLGVFLINSIWLFPLALAVAWQWLSPWVGLIIAYLPLILTAIKSNAGLDESQITKSNP
jgi:Fuc2NAc and GlcNAc transferase